MKKIIENNKSYKLKRDEVKNIQLGFHLSSGSLYPVSNIAIVADVIDTNPENGALTPFTGSAPLCGFAHHVYHEVVCKKDCDYSKNCPRLWQALIKRDPKPHRPLQA